MKIITQPISLNELKEMAANLFGDMVKAVVDIEKKIRDQFLMFNIVDKEVRSKITVKPEEITKFYENNKKIFKKYSIHPENFWLLNVSFQKGVSCSGL